MKKLFVLILVFSLINVSCQKERTREDSVIKDTNASQDIANISGSGSGGSGGSGGGGGGTTPTGLIQSFLTGTASRLVATRTDSVLVSFTQPAPAGGWTLSLSSSNPAAAQIPSTHFVPPGVRGVYVPVTGGNIANAVTVTLTVRLGSESRTNTIKVFPLTASFPATQLQSPGNGANFKPREIITFQWNANNNAYYYQLQIANNNSFVNPETNLLLNDPFWRQSAFSGSTLFWRVRFVDASGNGGPWSQVRTFSIRD